MANTKTLSSFDLEVLKIRKRKFSELMGKAANRGLSEAEVAKSLGLAVETFKRVLRDAKPDRFPESAIHFLNAKMLQRFEAICDALKTAIDADRVKRTDSVDVYVRDVKAEFSKFVAGEEHVLVTLLPPLECFRREVAAEVVSAALKGVFFQYRFPSDEARAQAFPFMSNVKAKRRDTRAQSVARKQRSHHGVKAMVEGWDGSFEQMPSCDDIAMLVQYELIQSLKTIMVTSTNKREHFFNDPVRCFKQLRSHVEFHKLEWSPIMFNEKLTWSNSPRIGTAGALNEGLQIRKEIVFRDSTDPGARIYGDQMRWMRIPLDLPQNVIDLMTPLPKDSAIPWPDDIEVMSSK